MSTDTFSNLDELAGRLRTDLKEDVAKEKNFVLIFAYNGIGKTRLSTAFKDAGKKNDTEGDTLYFNAFTEDLFTWDNDLDNDTQRVLHMNKKSDFFVGLDGLALEEKIFKYLERYADFGFRIDYKQWTVTFSRGDTNCIKISRGEENIFIWCFFLAIAQLAIDRQETYKRVNFLYIDDPISSLDDNNAIAMASHLAQLLKNQSNVKAIISSHHTLFFNVMCNELKKAKKYFLSTDSDSNGYTLRNTNDTPFFQHVALLKDLHEAADSGNLYTYHFNMLRNILEKTAAFHGFDHFSACIKKEKDDVDGITHARMVSVLNHGKYSLFEPMEMVDENKQDFKKILKNFMTKYPFNPDFFPEETTQEKQT